MALTSISVQPQQQQEHSTASTATNSAVALMGMLLALYLTKKGTREFRKLKRKLTFALLKNKIRSLFARKAKREISTTTLLLILVGVLALALIFVEPIVGLAVLVLGVLIILLVRGGFTAAK
jgi:hypothetical protein